ncbi:non-ribosomal peptide synthetase [Kribbella sandramycini]|uniref:Amino acid adenylation domain-containing protein n=1 Tax=Kribbella sandramycini TaxID=60450 RepID=A0A7Y4P1A4_9ACTN|nr:non-ribosomal peptide synthetase [Kribbella sandramycini]MBB6566592.1 amino acid adenylation domain-containing protein [Kribbella sandramycini]NOL42753.1 non-ribosomal peptide synthetase [Kribbella sandramycini]
MDNAALLPGRPPAAARTLLDILDATVAAHPDAPAIDDGDTVLTYAEFARHVAEIATRLRSDGVGPGDRIGIRMKSGRAELYLTILGILAAGAAYVPVDVDDPDERAAAVWADAEVCGVFDPEFVLRAQTQGAGRPGPDDDAWIIFTSGTTGRPKGVAVTHVSAAAFADAEARLFTALGPGDRVLAGFSVAFDASCEEMWLAWRSGACLMPAPRELVRSGADLCPWLVERGITVISTVPTLAGLWPGDALPGVRLLIFGGEACPPELAKRFITADREVWNTYGPTETTVVACAWRMVADETVRIGTPLDGWQLSVVDDAGRPVEWGATGELVIGGVGVARYLDPELEAGRFQNAPRAYRSGDLVRAERAGLIFVGRNDEQVKIRGHRIEPAAISAVLTTHPQVAQAHVGVADGRLIAYVVLRKTLEMPELRQFLGRSMPRAMVPEEFVVLDALPVTTSGKIDVRALPVPEPAAVAVIAPDASTAEIVTAVWSEVLGVPELGPDDSFFDLGGHSLSAAQARDRLSAVLGRPIATLELFTYPTVRELAARLRDPDPASTLETSRRSAGGTARTRLSRRRDRLAKPTDPPS